MTGRVDGARRTRCCSPSRSRSARAASGRCSCAGCRRASSRGRARPSRSCPTSAGASWRPRPGLRLAAARGRARPRALPVLRVRLARDRAGRAQLPQLRRGGQPRAALAVHRRRRRAVRARAGASAARGGCSPTSSGPPTRRRRPRELARSRRPHRAPAAGEPAAVARTLGEVALRHVRHREILSAGALETYADCPVKWLVERELQPERLEPEADPLARGSSCTRCSSELLRGSAAAHAATLAAGRTRILERVLAAERPARLARRPPEASARRRCGRSRPTCAAIWSTRRATAPAGAGGLELRFGFEARRASLPALTLGEGADRVLGAGRDRPGRRRRATAARSSATTRAAACAGVARGARWSADRQLQVALYMLAVRELLGLEPVAGFYQPLGGDDLRARGVFLDGTPTSAPGRWRPTRAPRASSTTSSTRRAAARSRSRQAAQPAS